MNQCFGGFSMYLWMFIQWGLLLIGVYLIIQWVKKTNTDESTTQEDPAVTILRERYAQGELSDEEFDKMMIRLKQGRKEK